MCNKTIPPKDLCRIFLGISIIYVRVDDYDEDNIMWYMILIDNVVAYEPEQCWDAGEGAERVYDRVVHYMQGREDYMVEMNEWIEEMGEREGKEMMRENVIEDIESILYREVEDESVYGVGFMFDEDGWGRVPRHLGIHW